MRRLNFFAFCLCLAISAALLSTTSAGIKVEPQTTVQVGQEVFFDGSGVTIEGGELLSNGMINGIYEWDFGDDYSLKNGSPFSGNLGGTSVTHFYMRPGTYTVTLTVTDVNGKSAVDTTTITVTGEDLKLPPRSSTKPILELKFENNLNDTSPSGLIAEWRNGSGGYVRGIEGQAADLTDGSYIAVLDPTGVLGGMSELTISVWAKDVESSSTGYLIDNSDAYKLHVKADYPRIGGYVKTTDTTLDRNIASSDINNKLWHHYVVTYDGTTLRTYVDQIETVESGLCPMALTGTVVSSTNGILIGVKADMSGAFDGHIDEVKIYDKALTAHEAVVGFELWHADFHGHTAQYIYAQIPTLYTADQSNKIKAVLSAPGYLSTIYEKTGLSTEEIILLDQSSLNANDYTLTVQILDAGNNTLEQIVETFSKPYNGVPKVGIDENNAIRVNGELFFPVLPNGEGCNSAWAHRYVNALYTQAWYPEYTVATWTDYLDKAAALDLQVWGPGWHDGTAYPQVQNSDPTKVADYVTATKDHAGLLGWYWGDEPEYHGMSGPVVRSKTYISHRFDPNHLVATNYMGYTFHRGDWATGDWINSCYLRKEWVYYHNADYFGGKRTPVADVVGFSYFPIFDFPGATAAKFAMIPGKIREENYNLLPVFAYVQRRSGVTPEQIRMFAWLAVVNGVKGIKWKPKMGLSTPPENFAVMVEFLDDITKLTPIVLGPETTRTVTDNANEPGKRVDAMIKEDGDDTWMFAVRVTEVNETSFPPIDVTFTVEGLTPEMSVIEPGEFSQTILEYQGNSNLTSARREFSFTLNDAPIVPGTIQIAGQYSNESLDYIVYLYDDGNGRLFDTGPGLPRPLRNVSGSVNYLTGEIYVDFGEVKMDWANWQSVSILSGEDMVRATYRPLRNDRIISHTANTFADSFAPNAVHIYKISKSYNGNHAPELTPIGNKSVQENESLTFSVTATDSDKDTITYSVQNLPNGATFANQVFSWTPSLKQTGAYQCTFIAHDGRLLDSETITITVNNVNQAPILAAIGDKVVLEGSTLSFSVSASDADGDTITYSVQNLPSGAAFAGQTFTWTPAYNQAGTYQVTFNVSDGPAQDSETITITVENVNQAPVLSAIGDQSVFATDPLTFSVAATDADGDSINYSAQGLPSGATFSSQTFTWTPVASQTGTYSVTFIASDGPLQDSEAITITVYAEDKSPPAVTNCSPAGDSIQTPLNSLLMLHIVDTGKGVDASSVTIKVNGNTVYTGDTAHYGSSYGDCRRTGTKADYVFSYQPNGIFDFEQEVTVAVNATDLGGNAMSEYRYSFWTDMRSFGGNKNVSSGLGDLTNAGSATVCDSGGNIWAVWHAGPAGSRGIYLAKLAEGAGSFGDSIQLTLDSADQCNPAVALDSSDNLYVVWQDNRRGNWDTYISSSVDGINWSAERRVADSNDNEMNPAIVIDASNRAHVVWQDDRAGNWNIYTASSSDTFATKTVSQITSHSSHQLEPAIAVSSDNTVYVVWTDQRNGRSDIYGWDGTQIMPVVSKASNQSSPAIAAEGSILHLLWVDDTPGDTDIYYGSSTGLPSNPLTGSSIIDDSLGADQLQPAIAVTGTGETAKVFACWQDRRNADTDIYFVEVSADGWTNVFVGDDATNSNQSDPAMGVDAYAHPYIIWTDNRGVTLQIYYAGSTYLDPAPLASELASPSSGAIVGTNPANIDSVDDVSVVVPPGACSSDTQITISRIRNPQEFAAQCLAAYDFGPSGMQFNQPVTITIPYAVAGNGTSATPYWFNSVTGMLSQQGMTDIQDIVISPTLHALSFKTTHFTAFYVMSGTVAATDGGGGGGGCALSANGEGSVIEFLLPYLGLATVMVILKVYDTRGRRARIARGKR